MDQLISEIVAANFISVPPDCTIREAVRRMHDLRSTSVIIEEGGEPVGIFTERDAVGLLLETFDGVSWQDLPIKHVMTTPVIAICDDCTLGEGLAIARGGKIRHVPVINEWGKVAGVLNQGDMLRSLYEYCQNHNL